MPKTFISKTKKFFSLQIEIITFRNENTSAAAFIKVTIKLLKPKFSGNLVVLRFTKIQAFFFYLDFRKVFT